MIDSVDKPFIDTIFTLAPYQYLKILSQNVFPSLLYMFYLLCTGSLFFDVIHHMLHRCNRSSHPLLQRLARVHRFHHLYFTRHMQFDKKYLQQNRFQALPLELALQVLGTILGYILASFMISNVLVWSTRSHLCIIIGIQMLRTAFVIFKSGRDSNHLIYKIAPKDPNWLFVGPEFHSLHHVYPDRYIGSFIKVLDWILGTAYSFRRKRFVITGASGAFGRAIVTELEREGVNCIRKLKFGTEWDHNNFEKALAVLSTSDVLILAHGTKDQDAIESNCNSAIRLIELFKQYRVANSSDPTLPEVWYLGSEIEFHPSWGNAQLQRYSQSKRQFLPHARSFYDDPDILYRHIVPVSFHSSMGPAILAADGAAKWAMWWIRRGARYVPVTYTGIAYLNYIKFKFSVPYVQEACVDSSESDSK